MHYDRPCLVCRVNVHTFLRAPFSKSNSTNLHRLHDIVNQHLWALVTMKQDITESFITSMLKLELDQATIFEWQRHSQDSNDVLHYSAPLEFLYLRAKASEYPIPKSDHKRRTRMVEKNYTGRHHHTQLMWMTSAWFASWADTPCMLVKSLRVTTWANVTHPKAEWVLSELLQARPPLEAMSFCWQVSKVPKAPPHSASSW